jgi:ATP/maltotriose-dependent transcriptional regulator MalT
LVLWPPLVRAALAASDLDLAEHLLEPVETTAPGLVPSGVAAQWHHLRGLVAVCRGDAVAAEVGLTTAIEALQRFGATGYRARAQEDLGRWLVSLGKHNQAAEYLVAAQETYETIGARGWSATLATWQDSGTDVDRVARSVTAPLTLAR